MKAPKYLVLAAVALPMVLASCRGQVSEKPPIHPNMNMDDQERFEAQEENPFFENNSAMRQPVEGTVARGNLKEDNGLYRGINDDSSFVTEIPVEVDRSFIYRGKDQYEVFCEVCHGGTGDGQGIIMVNNYGYVPAPSFHDDRLRDVEDGYLYSVIANGIRNMPSYAHQIDPEDRWAIVAYLRALQESQNVPEEEIQQYDVDIAALQEDFKQRQAEEQAKQEAQAEAGGGEISAERGETIATDNGCMACHSIDGTESTGPTWQGLFGHEVELTGGETVTADEEYIRESIVDPNAKLVDGYQGVMPSYDYLADDEIDSIVEYIKSLSNE